MRKIIVTGAAGFIGYHLCKRLLENGDTVAGVDNLNDYYDISLKNARLEQLKRHGAFKFYKMPLEDRQACADLFRAEKPDLVVNLAAQPGVRYSLVNPYAYIDSNISGFLNILEGCRHTGVKHLVFASSSSVYGANTKMPFSVHDNVDHPVSLYAATKKSNELMAHAYASLYKMPCTCLRFFTVYGPWGRPDMAYYLFAKAIMQDKPIDVFNYGKMRRDFTYVDDIVEGIVRIADKIPEAEPEWDRNTPDPSSSYAPYKIYNIGNNSSVELDHFIQVLEDCLGKKAIRNLLPMQAGDVEATYADVDDLMRVVGYKPSTPIETGLARFAEWFKIWERQ